MITRLVRIEQVADGFILDGLVGALGTRKVYKDFDSVVQELALVFNQRKPTEEWYTYADRDDGK